MRTAQEPRPERWRRVRPRHKIIRASLTVIAGLLLAAGFTTAPARAALAQPDTLKTCETGTNNTYEYYGWCDGTGPTSYRAIAYCTQDEAAFGIQRWDGDRRLSYASCHAGGATLSLNEDWGYLLCSTSNGAGTYQGYVNKHGDISWILLNWGGGTSITAGGNLLCDYNVSGEALFNPNAAP